MEILLEFKTHGQMDSATSPILDRDPAEGAGHCGEDNDSDGDGGDDGDRSKASFRKSQTGKVSASE